MMRAFAELAMGARTQLWNLFGMLALGALLASCGGGGGGGEAGGGDAASASSGFGTYLKPFAADSPWNSRPIDPVLGSETVPVDKSGYRPIIAGGPYSTMFALASSADAPRTVYAADGATLNLVYGTAGSVTIPHWPSSATPASGGDGHLDIYDPETGIIHSFWKLTKLSSGSHAGEWTTTLYNWTRIGGRGWGDPALFYQGARATGVPTMGGIIRTHEVDDGDTLYRHVLAMSLTYSGLSANPSFVFPATAADSDGGNPKVNTGSIPEGALLMLPASFDESQISSAKLLKVVRTLKTYGARVVDRNVGTPFSIYVEGVTDSFNLCPAYSDYANKWSIQCSRELDLIRAALHPLTAHSGWITGDGKTLAELPQKLRMVAGRGSLVSSTLVSCQYNVLKDRIDVVAGATGANTANIQERITAGITPQWTAGKTYLFSVESSSPDIKASLSLINSSGSVDTAAISGGQSARITAPDGVWSFAGIKLSVADRVSGWIRVNAVEQ
jgi:hypothetical protein